MKSFFHMAILILLIVLCGCTSRISTHKHQFVLKDPDRIAKSFTLIDKQGNDYELEEGVFELPDGEYFYKAISLNFYQEGSGVFDADSKITYEPAKNSITREIMPDDLKETLAKCVADPNCTVIKLD